MDFKQFSNLIMAEQTLFALPFALLGVLFAGGGTVSIWISVIVALSAARTAGMSFNRVIDAEIDGRNPRTKDRLLPAGQVSRFSVWSTAVIACLVLVAASRLLNDLCFYLSFPALVLLFTYSYFKRFSASSHFYLGLVESAAPIGGYLAVTGTFSLTPFVLGGVILFWIAGLDIVYALQDEKFDRQAGLRSLPVRYGRKKALLISSLSYGLSVVLLFLAGLTTGRGPAFWVGAILVGGLFIYQQQAARRDDAAKGIETLFKVNMLISPILFVGTALDVWLPSL